MLSSIRRERLLKVKQCQRKSSPKSDQAQSRKFIEAAREADCTEDESVFDEIVKKVAKASPPRQADMEYPKKDVK
jgi:hypothetical protein